MELISIIIPVYNVEEFIKECLESIVHQSYQNIEIILVDDGSPDRCPAICDGYAQRDSRVKVIHQSNGGLSAARNSGIKAASGDYVSFVDSDDYVSDDFIEQMYRCAVETDADIVCCGMKVINSNRTLIQFPDRVTCYTENRIKLLVQENGTGDYYMNKLFKRILLDDFELPVGKLFEDIYSMHFLYAKAEKVVWMNACLYYYRINVSGISHSRILNYKFIDFVYANRSQYDYVDAIFPAYSELSLRKYAGAITHAAEVYMQKADRRSLPGLLSELTRLSLVINSKVLENINCSSQMKYEIIRISGGAKSWIKYYYWRELVKGLHNHPGMQAIISKVFKWGFIPSEE